MRPQLPWMRLLPTRGGCAMRLLPTAESQERCDLCLRFGSPAAHAILAFIPKPLANPKTSLFNGLQGYPRDRCLHTTRKTYNTFLR